LRLPTFFCGSAQISGDDGVRTFKGIDFDGQTRRMMKRIEQHTLSSDDPFWAYFHGRRRATNGSRDDDLLLLASFVNQIRERFESQGDEEEFLWLEPIENECFRRLTTATQRHAVPLLPQLIARRPPP
jgi:hypothetical protein